MDPVSYRKSQGLSQAALAERLGIRSRSHICELEAGEKPWPLKLALALEQLSEGRVPADALVSDDDRQLLKAHRDLSAAAAADQAARARA